MNLNPRGILGVVIVTLLVLASILLGNWFLYTFFHMRFSELPTGLRAVVHLCGAVGVAWILVKIFKFG